MSTKLLKKVIFCTFYTFLLVSFVFSATNELTIADNTTEKIKIIKGTYDEKTKVFTPLIENGKEVIEEVDLDDYVRDVVPKEIDLPGDQLTTTLKAQAIAARTYAIKHLNKHKDKGADLCNTTHCQVWKEGSGTALEDDKQYAVSINQHRALAQDFVERNLNKI